jgi:hypothetical protein
MLYLLACLASIMVSSALAIYIATRPVKQNLIRVGEYLHSTGRYCSLIVREDRDWRGLPAILSTDMAWYRAWHVSFFVGRDCEKRQDQGVWTDIGWDLVQDATNQISGGFTDDGFTITRRDGRSVFVPSSLYIQKSK